MDEQLSSHLEYHLKQFCHYSPFQEVLLYASLPAGKLFRPKLACAYYRDLTSKQHLDQALATPNSPLSLLCCALELHHAYTLVHDDLPAMDDDDERRGKPSVHKRYQEWQAILAGDTLLHSSHQLIGRIDHPHTLDLHRAFSWALGGKGLILGQVFDLGGEISKDFPSLLRTHELKTGRLIQMALLGASLLARTPHHLTHTKQALRLGMTIGLSFQLLDDLSECVDELSAHEQEVSPFLNFSRQACRSLETFLITLQSYEKLYPHTHAYLTHYLRLMKDKIEPALHERQSMLYHNLGEQLVQKTLRPLMALL